MPASKKPIRAGTPPKQAAPSETPCADTVPGCEVSDLFRILGKAHMLDLLYVFLEEADGPRRFVDVQTRLALSPNTLSERLRELVDAGLLSRTAYNEIPPRVDYEATAKARDLRPVFATLIAWATRHNLQAGAADASAPAVV